PPGGESFASLHNRVADALADFGDETLVVAHAGVIRAAMMLFHGQTFDEVFATKIPFCEPIVLERQMA
ncbi:MAG: histidine phosphatase family protein, partial [Pseudomonadota bacterium]